MHIQEVNKTLKSFKQRIFFDFIVELGIRKWYYIKARVGVTTHIMDELIPCSSKILRYDNELSVLEMMEE